MPFVRGYVRRTAGSGRPLVEPKRLDVAVYDAGGVEILREPTGGRYGATGLLFDSTLPGGFGACSFDLPERTARHWAGRAGLTCVVRRGRKVLWWGWVEDIQRSLQGDPVGLTVSALGPYQDVQQQLCSVNLTGTVYGEGALAEQLQIECLRISRDYSQFQATNVNLAPLTWQYKWVADLVKLVCDAGNASGQQMLFAIWEPTYRGIYPTTQVQNTGMEAGTSSPTGWAYTATSGSSGGWSRDFPHTGVRCLSTIRTSGTATQTGYWAQTSIPCSAQQQYAVDLWLWFGPATGMAGYFEARWKNSGGTYLSSSTGTTRSYNNIGDWQRFIEVVTSPANAASFDLRLYVSLPNSAFASLKYDDVYVYQVGSNQYIDDKPRAALWPRDLAGYEYVLNTEDLEEPLGVNLSTRQLANNVLASYGSSSYTALAQDADSQGLYRMRDALVAAGSEGSATMAAAVRDAYLARWKRPIDEPQSFRLTRPGAVRNLHGLAIWPEDLRAGDRLKITDGRSAGTVILLQKVAYGAGTVTCTPQRSADVPMLLAKVA